MASLYTWGKLVCVEPKGITISFFELKKEVFIPMEQLKDCYITNTGDLFVAIQGLENIYPVGGLISCRTDLIK